MERVGKDIVDRLKRFTDKLESVESAKGLAEIVTVRKVKLNLQPQEFSGEDLKAIRKTLQVSQAVFAQFLGVSLSGLQDWEQGRNKLIGPVCRLLEEMQADLEGWAGKIRELGEVTTA
jgi:DNA-binding transcriptional regulator YiaG